jgi:hypothetical protein
VYDELRKLAAHKLANEAAGQTLQANVRNDACWATPFLASRRLTKEKEISPPVWPAGRVASRDLKVT